MREMSPHARGSAEEFVKYLISLLSPHMQALAEEARRQLELSAEPVPLSGQSDCPDVGFTQLALYPEDIQQGAGSASDPLTFPALGFHLKPLPEIKIRFHRIGIYDCDLLAWAQESG